MPIMKFISIDDNPAELLNGPGEPSYTLTAFGTTGDNEQEIELTRDEWLSVKEHVARLRGYTPPSEEAEAA
jgi:hypothetical protein